MSSTIYFIANNAAARDNFHPLPVEPAGYVIDVDDYRLTVISVVDVAPDEVVYETVDQNGNGGLTAVIQFWNGRKWVIQVTGA